MVVGGDRQRVVAIDKKIIAKRGELGRAKSSSTQQRLARELERLDRDRVAAQEKVTKREKSINELESKVAREETKAAASATKEQNRQDAARAQQSRRVEGLLSATSSAVEDLTSRVSGIEDALLDRVRHEVAADPVGREHDVFLSHASADNEVATQLYDELTARGLDTWFDGAELRLGESLMRQIDRGIAGSRCGLLLITVAFLEGRFWTEREIVKAARNPTALPKQEGVDVHTGQSRRREGLTNGRLFLQEAAYGVLVPQHRHRRQAPLLDHPAPVLPEQPSQRRRRRPYGRHTTPTSLGTSAAAVGREAPQPCAGRPRDRRPRNPPSTPHRARRPAGPQPSPTDRLRSLSMFRTVSGV